MPIDVKLDLVMVKKRMSLTGLSGRIGISMTNLSLLKTGKVKGIRFSTLEALCRELDCGPGDILEYVPAVPGDGAGRVRMTGRAPAPFTRRTSR